MPADSDTNASRPVLEQLRRAVELVPVPGGPVPRRDRHAEIGAGLLDAAQRQQHVRRVSDHLVVDKESLARRHTWIDLSLDLLTAEQRKACELLESLHGTGRSAPGAGPGVAWVPVARVSRTMFAPLRVTNADGSHVPVLTTNETAHYVSAGVCRAVRAALWSLLARSPGRSPAVEAWANDQSARWLLDAAVDMLVVRGDDGLLDDRPPLAPAGASADAETRAAVSALLGEARPALALLGPLLDLAFTTRIVVAGLDLGVEEHALEYTTELLNSLQQRRPSQAWRRRLATGWRDLRRSSYGVLYTTVLPATISQYHLTLDVGPDVRIARSCLVSDAADAATAALRTDLRELADAMTTAPTGSADRTDPESAVDRALRIEADATEARAQDVLRRWLPEAVRYFGGRDQIPEEAVGSRAAHELVRGGSPVGEVAMGRTRRPELAERLRHYAGCLERQELGRDVRYRDDGPGDRRHLRWSPETLETRPAGDVRLDAGFALVSDGEIRRRHVPTYLSLLFVVTTVITAFLGYGWWQASGGNDVPEIEVDAAVTLLFLVPGFVLSRLLLSGGRLVRNRLLRPVRWTTLSGVVLSAIQAFLLVLELPVTVRFWAFVVVLVLEALLLLFVWVLVLRRGSRDPRLPPAVMPAWMLQRPAVPGPAPHCHHDIDMSLRAPGA